MFVASWTRPCCASLPGLWNRFSQSPQACTVVLAWRVCPRTLDGGTASAALAVVLDPVFGHTILLSFHLFFAAKSNSAWR